MRIATFVLLAALLTGCVTPSKTESKRHPGSTATVNQISVVYYQRSNIRFVVHKGQMRTPPKIEDADVKRAAAATAQLDNVLHIGFYEQFVDLVRQKNLNVVRESKTVPQLKIIVASRRFECFHSDCKIKFELNGDLLDQDGKPIWHFTKSIGQSSPDDPITSELFAAFANDIVDSMRRDGVLLP